MEAHVHVVLPQDAIADAGRHGRGESVEAAAASGPCAVVWERHGRAEELGEFLRRALVHALQRHGEVERIEDTLRDLPRTDHFLIPCRRTRRPGGTASRGRCRGTCIPGRSTSTGPGASVPEAAYPVPPGPRRQARSPG